MVTQYENTYDFSRWQNCRSWQYYCGLLTVLMTREYTSFQVAGNENTFFPQVSPEFHAQTCPCLQRVPWTLGPWVNGRKAQLEQSKPFSMGGEWGSVSEEALKRWWSRGGSKGPSQSALCSAESGTLRHTMDHWIFSYLDPMYLFEYYV